VIARPDGTPTYNFCVVIDDLEMGITHVIRGDDHVNNTPRQINIIRALGAEPPVYAHLPTVLTPDGDKLSKRHGAKSVLQYRDDGYLPEAVVNYLARLGWAHGDDEIFSREQFRRVVRPDGAVVVARPLRSGQAQVGEPGAPEEARARRAGRRLVPYLTQAGLDPAAGPPAGAVGTLVRDRVATLTEMADAAHYFYATPHPTAGKVAEHAGAATRPALAELDAEFATLAWTREALGAALKGAAARHGLKPPQVMMALRVLVCGTPSTPAIDAVLALLGRDTVRARLAAGLARAT